MKPCPLPVARDRERLARQIAWALPGLRAQTPPPCRHPEVTLLMYWFPPDGSFDPCEHAVRRTWAVLGRLPTVLVMDRPGEAAKRFAGETECMIQTEPSLRPGDIRTMSADCCLRLADRFATRHVLIVQDDGWPLLDKLDDFLGYDYVGAPNVRPGLRAALADRLGLTVLNGGFSLRSRALCRAVAASCRRRPPRPEIPEDRIYCRRAWRRRFRFPPAAAARRFSEDTLDGGLLPPPDSRPMGFHRASTLLSGAPPKLTVVTAVRDRACYERCVRSNPHLAGARFVAYDNAADNRPVPERYNQFLEALSPDTEWILFAHEDFEVLEDPRPLLRWRAPWFPYGLIGTRRVAGCFILPFGALSDSDRDGGRRTLHRPLPWLPALTGGSMVDAFDCCGFFVHAELFRQWPLRFDIRFPWDLYAEDFCFAYQRQTGHCARLLPLRAHHWSRGDTGTEHFRCALAALNAKYAEAFFAGGTCTAYVGGRPPLRFRLWRRLVRLLMPMRRS